MFIRPLALLLGVCLGIFCLSFSKASSIVGAPEISQSQPNLLWKWSIPHIFNQAIEQSGEIVLDFSFCTDAYVSGLPGLVASSNGSEEEIPVTFSGNTTNGDVWSPPESCGENTVANQSHFVVQYFTVNQSGVYDLTGQLQGWEGKVILYNGVFDTEKPYDGCLAFSEIDLATGNEAISAINLVECSTYSLVVSGISLEDEGQYTVSLDGPGEAIAPETGDCILQNSGLYAEVRWYDQPTAGEILKTGNTFNPVSQGLIDPMMAGSYTYYAAFFSNGVESERIIASVDVGDCSVSITDPCSCRNNATNTANGQFDEVIEVEAPSGQTWTLLNNTGLYEPRMPLSVQSTNLLPAGTVLTEVPVSGGRSLYTLEGIHIDALGYEVDVTNGTTVLSQNNTCFYPNPVITNLPHQVCTQSPPFTLEGMADQAGSGSFTVDGVATSQFDPAALGVGTVDVEYTFNASGTPGPGVTEPGCAQSISQQVRITDDPLIACLANINVSLGLDCSIQITTDMLLTNDPCMVPGSFSLQVMTLDSVLVPNNIITEVGTYMGEVISNSGGNKCWGFIHAEDKIAPEIQCPDDVVIDCQDSTDPSNTGSPTATDNCNDVSFEYTDRLDLDDCSTGDIFRTWIAFDAFGNSDTCVQRIQLIDQQRIRVNWPDDFTVHCPEDQLSLHPDQLGRRFSRPRYSSNCRDLADNYRDEVYDICAPAAYKIHRVWRIRDWCDPDFLLEHTQEIKVLDTVAPVITCPDDLTLSVQHNSCEVRLRNYRPVVEDACDPDPQYTVRILDQNGQQANANRLRPGSYTVEFTATDACGNTAKCESNVEVQDLVAPVAVCDKNTNISLANDGWADLCYTVIDDQSADNCEIEEYLIKRDDEPDSEYRECITFRCDDIGLNVVRLRVIDIYGNMNECWANVYVEDKSDPSIQCPPDVTVNCDVDISDPDNTGGYPDVLGNCQSLEPSFIDERESHSCPTGVVIRRWTVEKTFAGRDGQIGTSDDLVKTANCEQRITIEDTSGIDIEWPNDLTIPCTGNAISLVPDDLHVYNRPDTIYDRPVVSGEDCEHLGISFEDQVFQLCGPESYKLRRVWHIVDWCSDLDTSYVQTLWVQDNTPPVLDVEDVVVDITTNDPECQAFVQIQAEAFDDCTSVHIQNNSPFSNSSDENASGIYPKGTTQVTFIASDACGNRTSKTVNVTVRDRKAPVAICGAGFSTGLKATGKVEVCAELFDRGSYDNCTFKENLVFLLQRLDDQGNEITNPEECIVFNCDDYIESAIQEVQLIVRDADGNEGRCRTFVQLQDQVEACGSNNNAPTFGSVSGAVTDPSGLPVDQLNIYIDQTMMAALAEGAFSIDSLRTGREYELDLERIGPLDEGVSTLDMVMVRRHILRLQQLGAPEYMIAADVNRDGRISTRDLVEMRQAILRLQTEFSGGYNWMFIPKAYQFPNPQDPWYEPFPTAGLIDLQGNMEHVDFTAIKIGDVNVTAMARSDESMRSVAFEYHQQDFSKGQSVRNMLSFKTPEMGLSGLQFCLRIPKTFLEDLTIKSQWLSNSDYRLLERAKDYILMVSWLPEERMKGNIELLELIGTAVADADWVDVLQWNEACLAPELYDQQANTYNIEWAPKANQNNEFELFQNIPNPFTSDTEIKFELPHDNHVRLEVFDVSGRRIWSYQEFYQRGVHSVKVESSSINQPGIYIYQLTSGEFQDSKRMVMME